MTDTAPPPLLTDPDRTDRFVRALRAHRIRGAALEVMLCLVTEYRAEVITVSDGDLGGRVGLDDRTVRKAKSQLEAAGFVLVTKRPGQLCQYRLALPETPALQGRGADVTPAPAGRPPRPQRADPPGPSGPTPPAPAGRGAPDDAPPTRARLNSEIRDQKENSDQRESARAREPSPDPVVASPVVDPETKTQQGPSSADLRRVLLDGYARRFRDATGHGWSKSAAGADHVERILEAVSERAGPAGEIERGLDAFFADCAAKGTRPKFDWDLSRDFGRWCSTSSLPAGAASERAASVARLHELNRRPIAAPATTTATLEHELVEHLHAEGRRKLGRSWFGLEAVLAAWSSGIAPKHVEQLVELVRVVIGWACDPERTGGLDPRTAITRALGGFALEPYARSAGFSIDVFVKDPGRYVRAASALSSAPSDFSHVDGTAIPDFMDSEEWARIGADDRERDAVHDGGDVAAAPELAPLMRPPASTRAASSEAFVEKLRGRLATTCIAAIESVTGLKSGSAGQHAADKIRARAVALLVEPTLARFEARHVDEALDHQRTGEGKALANLRAVDPELLELVEAARGARGWSAAWSAIEAKRADLDAHFPGGSRSEPPGTRGNRFRSGTDLEPSAVPIEHSASREETGSPHNPVSRDRQLAGSEIRAATGTR